MVLSAPGNGGVTYDDLESASKVVLVGLEPEDEAGAIWLRLHKAVRAGRTQVLAVAPYTSRGLRKLSARLIPTAPGDEATAIASLLEQTFGVDSSAVVLVGERLATVPGALSAASDLAAKSGARLAWVPRRAGDRGAVEAGCLPNLLPGGRPVHEAAARVDLAAAWGVDALPEAEGRDADHILEAISGGELGGLVIAGVDPADTANPAGARAAIEAAGFVVALDLRESEVTRQADVVLPVAPVSDKAGSFVNWEGRVRSFEAALRNPASLPDLRILSGIAEEMGAPLGFRTVPEVRAEMAQLGPWDGVSTSSTTGPLSVEPVETNTSTTEGGEGLLLATWKQSIDNGRMQDGDKYLKATARTPVALVSRDVYDACGPTVTITGDRGWITLPAQVCDDLVPGVVWVPANSFGAGVLSDLASPGSRVRVEGGQA